MGDCCRCNDFRFFISLRCVQNDRGKGAVFRMTGEEGAAFGVTGEEGAAFRMTGKGRCVRNGREEERAAFRMTEWEGCSE